MLAFDSDSRISGLSTIRNHSGSPLTAITYEVRNTWRLTQPCQVPVRRGLTRKAGVASFSSSAWSPSLSELYHQRIQFYSTEAQGSTYVLWERQEPQLFYNPASEVTQPPCHRMAPVSHKPPRLARTHGSSKDSTSWSETFSTTPHSQIAALRTLSLHPAVPSQASDPQILTQAFAPHLNTWPEYSMWPWSLAALYTPRSPCFRSHL